MSANDLCCPFWLPLFVAVVASAVAVVCLSKIFCHRAAENN